MKSPPFHLLLDSRLLFNSLTLLLALAAGSSVRATDQTWNNNAANLLWSTSAANWDAGVVWTNGNSALFGSTGAGTLNVDGTINVTSLTFSANGYIIGDADNNGTLTLGSGSVITVDSGFSATISEVIAGTNGFTKSGAGTLTLSGATSPSTGNTLVEAGTLAWGANDALPSGTVTVLSGATVDLTALSGNNNAATSSGRAYVIAGTGVSGLGAIVNNSGSLLSDAAISGLTLTADATISTGARLDISGTPNLGSFTLTKIGAERLPFRSTVNSPNASLVISAGGSYIEQANMTIGSITLANGTYFGMYSTNGSTTARVVTAAITMNGTSSLQQGSNGTPAVPNVFAGTILINGATASLRTGGLGSSSDVTFDSVISGTGTIVLDGNLDTTSAAHKIRFNAANTFTGDVRMMDEGTFQVGNVNALQNATLDMSYATASTVMDFTTLTSATFGGLKGNRGFALQNASATALELTVGGNHQSHTFSGSLTGAGSLVKTGAGRLLLTGANSFTGSTKVNQGSIGGTGSISGAVELNSTGGLDFRDSATGTFTLGSTLTINGGVGANLLSFDLASAGTQADVIAVTGDVSVTTSGAAIIQLFQLGGVANRVTAGTYDLITTTGSMAAASSFALQTTKAFGQTFSLALDGTGKKLQLTTAQVTSAVASAFWSGAGSANWSTVANWNTTGTSGISTGAAPDYQSNVTFSTTTPVAGNLATTLDADFDINSLTFDGATGGVSISGSKMLVIEATNANGNTAGNGITARNTSGINTLGVNVGLAASQTWTIASGGTLLVTGAISDLGGSSVLTKAGAGTLTFAAANAAIGAVTLNGGTLVLDYTAANSSKLSDYAVLTLGSGTLQLDRAAAATGSHVETVLSTTVSGAATITRGTGSSAVLQMNTLTRGSNSGSLNLSAAGIASTDTLNTNGILGTWVTINGTDFATNSTNSADGLITAFTGYTHVPRLTPGTILDGSTSHVRLIEGTGASGTIALGSTTTTISTLTQSTSGGSSAATVDTAGKTLAVNSILMASGAGALTIGSTASSGTLMPAVAGGELIVHNHSTNTLTINAVLANNSTASSFTKTGTGTVVLSGASSPATGNTVVQAGILRWGANDALPSGTVTVLDGGTVDLTALTGGTAAATGGSNRSYIIAGAGSTGQGALINNSGSLSGDAGVNGFTLAGDATVSTGARMDIGISGGINLGSYTLTKIGADLLPLRASFSAPAATLHLKAGGSYIEQNNMTIGTIIVENGAWFGSYVYKNNVSRTVTANIILNGTSSIRQGSNYTGSPVTDTPNSTVYAGTILVNGGTATLRTGGIGNSADAIFDSVISGTGIVVLDGETNFRTIRFNAANTFSGDVRAIDQGIFEVANTNALQNATFDTSTSTVNSVMSFTTLTSATFGGLKGNNGFALENASAAALALSVGNNGQNTSFSGVLSGSGSLIKIGAGNLTLSSGQTYTGATTVQSGSLVLSGVAASTGTGAVTVQNGGSLLGTGIVKGSTFTADDGSTIYAGNTNAASDHGTLTFTPASASGSTSSLQGTIVLGVTSATVTDRTFGGSNPVIGSAGYNAWVDSVSGVGAHDRLVFANPTSGTGYTVDFITATGKLQVVSSGFTPQYGMAFNLLDWGSLVTMNFSGFNFNTGYFSGNGDEGADLDLPDLTSAGWLWDVSRLTTSGVVVVVPEPGRALLLLLGLFPLLLRRRVTRIRQA